MDLTRATPPLLKHLNERTVLETIRAGAPISRAEISRRVGISKPTVSLALRSLVDAGLVREAPRGPDGPNYGAVFFEPVADAAFVLGLDLGARFLRGAVCDLAGQIRTRQDVELRGANADGALRAIAALHSSLVSAATLPEELDPSAEGIAALAAHLATDKSLRTSLVPPYDPRDIFAAARSADLLAQKIVEEAARRIAAHIAPVAAVADPELVVLGGGLGANGDLLLDPVRRLLREWMPYPPRVEISSLGEAAVLMGALAVGLRSALDNVFVNRPNALVR